MRNSVEIPSYTDSSVINKHIYKMSRGKIRGLPVYGIGAELSVLSDATKDGARFVRVGIPWGPTLERSYVIREDLATKKNNNG